MPQETDVSHINVPFPACFPCVMGSAGWDHSLWKGCRVMLPWLICRLFVLPRHRAPAGNSDFILKKIFANAICSFHMKSGE